MRYINWLHEVHNTSHHKTITHEVGLLSHLNYLITFPIMEFMCILLEEKKTIFVCYVGFVSLFVFFRENGTPSEVILISSKIKTYVKIDTNIPLRVLGYSSPLIISILPMFHKAI